MRFLYGYSAFDNEVDIGQNVLRKRLKACLAILSLVRVQMQSTSVKIQMIYAQIAEFVCPQNRQERDFER